MANKTEAIIDVIIHATEDIEKFYYSFEKIFNIQREQLVAQNLSGHYDNPITVLTGKFSKKNASLFVEKLIQNIPAEELSRIIEELDELVSNAGLHLRFDKQEFVKGKLFIQEKNALKVKIYTPVYNKKDTADAYLELLHRSN